MTTYTIYRQLPPTQLAKGEFAANFERAGEREAVSADDAIRQGKAMRILCPVIERLAEKVRA